LGISEQTVVRYRNQGKIEARREGKSGPWMVDPEAVDPELIEEAKRRADARRPKPLELARPVSADCEQERVWLRGLLDRRDAEIDRLHGLIDRLSRR
jgi:hypothetical protein